MTREKFKTYQDVFDRMTIKSIHQLTSSGYIHEMFGQISEGKESHVFYALNKRNEPIVVKVFLVETSDFKAMNKYIKGDQRFQGLRRKKRTLINAWTKKEYRNLLRAREVGLRVPVPHAVKNNVLVMEFIGSKKVPAPIAQKKAPKDVEYWCSYLKNFIKDLWSKAGLVHADLSEFNILNDNDKPVIIDWSSAVLRDHPLAHEFLAKDIYNLFNWLNKVGANPGSEKEFYDEVVKSVH